MNPLLIRRRGMMKAQGGGGAMVEIEYLESTGTQYIDTGVGLSTDCVAEITAQFLAVGQSLQVMAGSRYSTRNSGIIIALPTSGNLYCSVGDYSQSATSTAAKTDKHDFKMERLTAYNNQRLTVDGSLTTGASNQGRISTTPITLFAMNYPGFGGIINYSVGRIWSFKLTKSGSVVFDAIPVRVGTVGYMYDRVSGQLFGNLGTGDFILGPDIQ